MRLKQIRGALPAREVVKKLKEDDPRVDCSLYSKYETGLARPTPEQLATICMFLYCTPDEIYTDEEMNLAGCLGLSDKPFKRAPNPDEYKFTERVSRKAFAWMTKEALRELGFKSKRDWLLAMNMRSLRDYIKKRNGRLSGERQTTESKVVMEYKQNNTSD